MKKICITLFALMLTALLASCDRQGGRGAVELDEHGRWRTITVAVMADVVTMDPQGSNETHSVRIRDHIFDSLIYRCENQILNPGLATEWGWVDDRTVYFRLRQGVRFHDGSPFTAEDVKFTLERARDSPFVGFRYTAIDHVEIINPYYVHVHLHSTFALIFEQIAEAAAHIVPRAHVERIGPDRFASEPIGTGPYKFVNWARGSRIDLTRWDDHWSHRRGQTQNLSFRVITEMANRTIELETGGVDIAFDIPPGDVNRVRNDPRLQMLMSPSFTLNYIGINTERPPFNDRRVRQAMNYAIDMESIVEVVYGGIGQVLAGPLVSLAWGVDPDLRPFPHDPQRAAQLFAEAGFPNGFHATIWANENQQRIDMAEIIQHQLMPFGITLDISVLEWGTYLERTIAGEHHMAIFGWAGGMPDATFFGNFHSDSRGPDGNISFFSNAEFDRLLDASRNTMDDERRRQYYIQAQRLIRYEAPWIFVWEGASTHAARADLRGFTFAPDAVFRLWSVYIEG